MQPIPNWRDRPAGIIPCPVILFSISRVPPARPLKMKMTNCRCMNIIIWEGSVPSAVLKRPPSAPRTSLPMNGSAAIKCGMPMWKSSFPCSRKWACAALFSPTSAMCTPPGRTGNLTGSKNQPASVFAGSLPWGRCAWPGDIILIPILMKRLRSGTSA